MTACANLFVSVTFVTQYHEMDEMCDHGIKTMSMIKRRACIHGEKKSLVKWYYHQPWDDDVIKTFDIFLSEDKLEAIK